MRTQAVDELIRLSQANHQLSWSRRDEMQKIRKIIRSLLDCVSVTPSPFRAFSDVPEKKSCEKRMWDLFCHQLRHVLSTTAGSLKSAILSRTSTNDFEVRIPAASARDASRYRNDKLRGHNSVSCTGQPAQQPAGPAALLRTTSAPGFRPPEPLLYKLQHRSTTIEYWFEWWWWTAQLRSH